MNPRYRETFRRHPIVYSLPLVIVTLLAVWYVVGAPKSYEAAASLWVDTPAPEQSSLTQTNQFATTPAAQAQQLLNELLTTREFRIEVGRRGPLEGYLAAHPSSGFGPSALLATLRGAATLDNRVVAALGPKSVLTTVEGPQVLSVSVKGPTPQVALGTTRALVSEFNEQRTNFMVQRAQATLAYYKNQADAALQTLHSTQAGIANFMAANPGATASASGQTAADAQLRSLVQAEGVAKERHSAANRDANQAAVSLKATLADTTSFHILDQPALPTGPVSGKKKEVMAIIGGLFAGALLSFLALVITSGTTDPNRHSASRDAIPLRPGEVELRQGGGANPATASPVAEHTRGSGVAGGGH